MNDQKPSEDDFEYYILAENKKIRKQLIFKLIEERLWPEKILSVKNQFYMFLEKNGKQYLSKALEELKEIQEFNLTQWGTYLSECSHGSYLHFSEYRFGYYEKNSDLYSGFTYVYNESMFVGSVGKQLKPDKKGQFLLKEVNNDKIYWYEYDGQWNNGKIKKGTQKVYENEYDEKSMIVEYEGEFKDFKGDGKGTRKIRKKNGEMKVNVGEFKNGRLVRDKGQKMRIPIGQGLMDDNSDMMHNGSQPREMMQSNSNKNSVSPKLASRTQLETKQMQSNHRANQFQEQAGSQSPTQNKQNRFSQFKQTEDPKPHRGQLFQKQMNRQQKLKKSKPKRTVSINE